MLIANGVMITTVIRVKALYKPEKPNPLKILKSTISKTIEMIVLRISGTISLTPVRENTAIRMIVHKGEDVDEEISCRETPHTSFMTMFFA
jgi:hypothetical protein